MVTEYNRNPTENSRENLAGLQLFRSPSGWSYGGQPASGLGQAEQGSWDAW